LHQFPGRAFSFTPPKKSLLLLLLLLLFSLFFSCCCCCCCCCYCVLSVCLSVPTSPGSFLPHLCSLVSFFQQIELTTSPFSSLHFLSSRTLFPTHIHAHPILFLPLLFAASFPSLFFCCWSSSAAAAASSFEPCFVQAVAFRSFCVRRSGARSGFRVHRSRALYVSTLPKQTHTKR
jgi:hypothetical protein